MELNKSFDDKKIVKEIYNNDRIKRYSLFLVGVFLQAASFNLFILPSDMTFGINGVSVVLKQLLGINPATIIMIANLLLLVASFVYLGKSATSKTIVGSILYPILVELTVFLPVVVNFGDTEPVIIALSGAVLYGFGSGFVFKAGYTTGGVGVLKQIVSQYGNMTLGQATIYIEGFVITSCLFVFGWQAFIYSILSLFVISFFTDKVVLGISKYKTFQIITNKEKEVKQFILNQLHHGVTILDSHGGYTGDKKRILLCTVPTKKYFILKEGILQIDNKAFFIVTDAYEVEGGK
ncbi:MAG: YitT family protein [Bacilli bacterium]|nr:YitT family protein [Bacilli bacterium]